MTCKRAGCIKPDALENVHMTFVQTFVKTVELIPEPCESDEIVNIDSVDTRSYHCKVIYFSTFRFPCEPGIKIALLGIDSPFSWLKGFFFGCVGGGGACEGFVT
jgi:hypothetical protein